MVLGISQEPVSIIRQFVAEQGITFPILQDKGGEFNYLYRLAGAISPFPRDYIIDKDGTFVYTSTEFDIRTMILMIEKQLQNPAGTVPGPEDSEQARHPEFGLF